MIKLCVLGTDGYMGMLISRLAITDPEKRFEVTHGYTIPESSNIGKDIGILIGQPETQSYLKSVEQFEKDMSSEDPNSLPDVIIDFTVAGATETNAAVAVKNRIPIVIGTTGLSDEFYSTFPELCKENKCSVVLATNMATGVNIFFKIVKEITKYLKNANWDIEVIEKHHHRKRDAPSGTAITIAENIAEALGKNLSDVAQYGRDKGLNPRKIGADEIGIHAVRAGDIVGQHEVLYAGPGERIEFTHMAHNRECFATGSLTAADFLSKLSEEDKNGKIFDMQDVLGLKD